MENWQSSPDQIKGEDIGAELIRTIRMISRVKRRLEDINNEISELFESKIHQLMQRAREAKESGKDLLEQIATEIENQIRSAKSRLEKPRKEYGPIRE